VDPWLTAQRFASLVLGWDGVGFHVTEDPATAPLSSSQSAVYGNLPSGSGTASPSAGSATSPFRTFIATGYPNGCDLMLGCSVTLTMFQPLGPGEGSPWMVLEVRSWEITLSASAGDTIEAGEEVGAGFRVPDLGSTILGYRVDGSCDVSAVTGTARHVEVGNSAAGSSLRFQAPVAGLGDSDCQSPQPGYVYAAVASETPVGLSAVAVDPFRSSNAPLLGLTAVPVTFGWSDQLATSAPPTQATSPSPTDAQLTWSTYTDRLGWTIDVPEQWVIEPIQGETTQGAAFVSGTAGTGDFAPPPDGVTVRIVHAFDDVSTADDSSFPLSPTDLKGIPGVARSSVMNFRGDGLIFRLDVSFGLDADMQALSPLVDRMIASIRFEPWSAGETRNGWTAVGPVLASSTAEWLTFDGGHRYATNVDGRRLLIGPAPECQGEGSFEVREYGVAGVTCPDGTGGDWDLEGHPQPGNTTGFDAPLDGYLAVRSWDGQLLVQLDVVS
jgi:hypothetical protein